LGAYVPGRIVVGETLQDFVNQQNGLSSEDVARRSDVVGPNRTPVVKPTFLSALRKEFNRAFYVYQNFILWTWFPNFYFSQGLILSSIRLIGGCVSAYFHLLSDLSLYKVSQIEGEVK
jgi:Cation transporter/ATPase, N-terminus